MATLSVTLIVKNEEQNLAECLNSVKWADEIVVLDAGSNDKTVEIAKNILVKFMLMLTGKDMEFKDGVCKNLPIVIGF